MKRLIIFIIPFLLYSCRFASIGTDHSRVDHKTPDIVNNKINRLLYQKKNNITDELNVKSIEHGVDSLEIRLWVISGKPKGGEVFIIRRTKYKWNCYHYWFLERVAEEDNMKKESFTLSELANVGLDTFWIKKEVPRTGWNGLMTKLNRSELFKLDSYQDISLEVVEKINSYSFILEYATKEKYRLYWYSCSDIYRDCQRCNELIQVLNVFNSEFNFSNSLFGNYRCKR